MRLVIDLQGAQASNHERGIGRYARELALAMARDCRGHEVVLALNGGFPDTADTLCEAFLRVLPRRQIRVWEAPLSRPSNLGPSNLGPSNLGPSNLGPSNPKPGERDAAGRIRAQFLAGLAPDAVHVSSMFEGEGDAATTLHPSDLERLPTIATCFDLIPLIRRETYFAGAGTDDAQARWYFRCLQELSLCDGLLAISGSSRTEAIEHLAVPAADVFDIGTGVSPAFAPRPLTAVAREALLQRYGLRDGFVLFLGAGERRKNEAGLIAAYARLPQDLRARHQLVIVGRVPADALAAQAAALGVRAQDLRTVAFVAEHDLHALYSACTLFVFPSLHEGFGLPAAEAMACGAAVIASNTTSLPEVIGRPDALFDPHSPADIARVMRRALEDAAFRADLAAHAVGQVARLTWTGCAARAWDAIEEMRRRRQPHAARAPARVLGKRARLALVAPLPPQRSGIAAYARDLAVALARQYDITLVSEGPTDDLRLASSFPQMTPGEFARRWSAFDRVLYHVGNSDRHRAEIETLIEAAPGIVVMHDAFLSDYRMWLAHVRGSPLSLRNELYRSDGYPALWDEATFGVEEAVERYTTALHLLRHAVGVIQHSRHGAALLAPAFGARSAERIAVIALLRPPKPRIARAHARACLGLDGSAFVVCSFGLVHDNKLPHRLARAWAAMRCPEKPGRLVFVGEASPDLARSLCADATDVTVTGWVDDATYALWLAAADVAVQLRERSRGETSAAMYDALGAGLPLVVNRQGAAGELAENIVLAIPDRFTDAALAQAIAALRDSAARRSAIGAAARAYATQALAPRRIAAQYADAIERFYASGPVAARCAIMRDLANSATEPPRGALARSFRPPGARQLLIAVAEAATAEMYDIARRLLPSRTDARAELVRFHGGGIVYARRAATDLLGLGHMLIDDEAVDAEHGDILLCLGGIAETACDLAAIRRARRAGVGLVVVIRAPPHAGHALLVEADGVICLSEMAADAFEAWLVAAAVPRRRALSLGWIDAGATDPGEQIGRIVLGEAWQRHWSPD